MNNTKQLWILAGGNGTGKSTFYEQFLLPTGLPFINADILAKQLDPEHTEAVSYKAARLTEKLRINLLQSGESFCFETVFSHPSKIDFLASAKSLGYEIILVYIHLENAQLNQARVAQRVMQGGHNVPTEKIINRIPRTMGFIKEALPIVDLAQFYDNSSCLSPYELIATLNKSNIENQAKPMPEWAKEMLGNYI